MQHLLNTLRCGTMININSLATWHYTIYLDYINKSYPQHHITPVLADLELGHCSRVTGTQALQVAPDVLKAGIRRAPRLLFRLLNPSTHLVKRGGHITQLHIISYNNNFLLHYLTHHFIADQD